MTEEQSAGFAAAEAPRRGPGRPPLRPGQRADSAREDGPREQSSLDRARARADELREHLGDDMGDGTDKFFVDPNSIPEGWSYEWKRVSVYGKEDPSHMTMNERKGWEPVSAARHPELLPSGTKASDIVIDGMILCERPLEITLESKAKELRNARAQVRMKEEQLGAAPPGQFDRVDGNKQKNVILRKTVEPPIAVPTE